MSTPSRRAPTAPRVFSVGAPAPTFAKLLPADLVESARKRVLATAKGTATRRLNRARVPVTPALQAYFAAMRA